MTNEIFTSDASLFLIVGWLDMVLKKVNVAIVMVQRTITGGS